MPIFLFYSWLFEIHHSHDCNVNAHANIFALFLTLCAHCCKTCVLSDKTYHWIRKLICVAQRKRSIIFLGDSSGGGCVYTVTVQLSQCNVWPHTTSHDVLDINGLLPMRGNFVGGSDQSEVLKSFLTPPPPKNHILIYRINFNGWELPWQNIID